MTAATATTTAPVLEARGLCAGYGKLQVLRDLDLHVAPGEVVALLGPNGAGKTTALLALSGALPAMSGEVRLFGEPDRSPLSSRVRRGLAMVTDDRSIFMKLTGRENVSLGRGDVETVLEEFPELEGHLDKPAGLLSGGQQQMLGVGRALSAKPQVLLADELSLGLAPILVQRLLSAVRRAADRGAAVLIVEQYARHALAVADRGVVLAGGQVVREGAAAELSADQAALEQAYFGGS